MILVVDDPGKTRVKEPGFSGAIDVAGFVDQSNLNLGSYPRFIVMGKNSYTTRVLSHEQGHRLSLGHDHETCNLMSYNCKSSTLNAELKKELLSSMLTYLFAIPKYGNTYTLNYGFGKASEQVSEKLQVVSDQNGTYTTPSNH